MKEKLDRVRKVFNESGKNQTQIGSMIGKTSQYVWKILNDDTANPSNSVLKDICREFNVNESWLIDGIGEMYSDKDMTFSEICSKIGVKDEKAKKAIVEYWHLSDEDKELFWNFVERFIK